MNTLHETDAQGVHAWDYVSWAGLNVYPKSDPMKTRLLKTFIAVYEERHITLAAERCFVTQPSISTNLKALEEQLGYKLFDRGSKGVTPTIAADKLYPKALRLLAEIDDLLTLGDIKSQPFTLGLPFDLSPKRMLLLLKTIREKRPDILLHVKDWRDSCDARVTLDIHKKDSEVFISLWDEVYLLCLPKGHELTNFERIMPEQLDGQILWSVQPVRPMSRWQRLKQVIGALLLSGQRRIPNYRFCNW